jgi:hypothetical protein
MGRLNLDPGATMARRGRSALVILLPCMTLLGCQGRSETTGTAVALPDTFLENLREVSLGRWEEEEGLLAIKYGLDAGTVTDVVRSYLSEQDDFIRLLGTPSSGEAANKPTIRETVERLANAHGIEPSVAAALLFDFTLARALHELGDADASR